MKTITSNEDCMYPSLFHEVKEFSLSIQDQGVADQATWTPCNGPHGPRTLSSSWILLMRSIQMPQTDP